VARVHLALASVLLAGATACGREVTTDGGEGGASGTGGFVKLFTGLGNNIVALQTTLTVPNEPPPSGALALWPGLQPLPPPFGKDFDPIGNGVLQSVLTWGMNCSPWTQPPGYPTWWVSAMYVNTMGGDPGYTGCYGGSIMAVAVGDSLRMTMTLAGTVWRQTVLDTESALEVAFNEDLMGQSQNIALFTIEEYSSAPVSDVVFTDTTITFAYPQSNCTLSAIGLTDFVSTAQPSADGMQCFIPKMVLRAAGVPADQ
jgi:hypothetical protein